MRNQQVLRINVHIVTRFMHENIHQMTLPLQSLVYHVDVLSSINRVNLSLLLRLIRILRLPLLPSARLPVMHLEGESSMSAHNAEEHGVPIE